MESGTVRSCQDLVVQDAFAVGLYIRVRRRGRRWIPLQGPIAMYPPDYRMSYRSRFLYVLNHKGPPVIYRRAFALSVNLAPCYLARTLWSTMLSQWVTNFRVRRRGRRWITLLASSTLVSHWLPCVVSLSIYVCVKPQSPPVMYRRAFAKLNLAPCYLARTLWSKYCCRSGS